MKGKHGYASLPKLMILRKEVVVGAGTVRIWTQSLAQCLHRRVYLLPSSTLSTLAHPLYGTILELPYQSTRRIINLNFMPLYDLHTCLMAPFVLESCHRSMCCNSLRPPLQHMPKKRAHQST